MIDTIHTHYDDRLVSLFPEIPLRFIVNCLKEKNNKHIRHLAIRILDECSIDISGFYSESEEDSRLLAEEILKGLESREYTHRYLGAIEGFIVNCYKWPLLTELLL